MTVTFAKQRAYLLAYLAQNGWTVTTSKHGRELKVPYAVLPHLSSDIRLCRLSFRTQAIYLGEHSLVSDMREVDGPRLEALAQKWAAP